MNPENRWVKKVDLIPWNEIEDRYASLFPSKTGHLAKPLRMALGSLIIQKQYGYSDRELVEQLAENPYYQYFEYSGVKKPIVRRSGNHDVNG